MDVGDVWSARNCNGKSRGCHHLKLVTPVWSDFFDLHSCALSIGCGAVKRCVVGWGGEIGRACK